MSSNKAPAAAVFVCGVGSGVIGSRILDLLARALSLFPILRLCEDSLLSALGLFFFIFLGIQDMIVIRVESTIR